MDRQHKWNAIKLLGQKTSHRDIPGMGMGNINARERLDLSEVQAERFERAFELAGGAIGNLRPRFGAHHMQRA